MKDIIAVPDTVMTEWAGCAIRPPELFDVKEVNILHNEVVSLQEIGSHIYGKLPHADSTYAQHE